MNQGEAIQRQFGAAAERYTASSFHQRSPDLSLMVDAASLRGDERVLDIGTGTGHTAVAFAPGVAEVVAIDLTPAMLEQARTVAAAAGVENVRFAEGDAMALPHADASFHVVTCRVCAHHFADPAAAMREAARVLGPGGRLLLVDSVSPEAPALDTFLNAIELLRDPSHVRNYSVSQWCAMLRAAGFAPEHLGTFPVPLDFHEWVERMRTPAPARTQLLGLFDGATESAREAFGLRTGENPGFDIPIALFRATLG